MYLTFPTKHLVHIHDDKTGLVVTCNSVPEPIESGQVIGPDQFVIYGDKHVYVYKQVRGSRSFTMVQMRLKNI